MKINVISQHIIKGKTSRIEEPVLKKSTWCDQNSVRRVSFHPQIVSGPNLEEVESEREVVSVIH